MEIGNIVEYIDNQKIICAVVQEVKNKRLRLLTETNREVNISINRLSHQSDTRLKLTMGRSNIVESLKATVNRRKKLMTSIDIKELWSVLYPEEEWIDLVTMTEFCFPNKSTPDHESAIVRAFFENRTYFKFNCDSFYPNSEKQVERINNQAKDTKRKGKIIEEGSRWLADAIKSSNPTYSEDISEFVDIIKSYYLFGNESKTYSLGKSILSNVGVKGGDVIFDLLIKLGVWEENENLDIYRLGISKDFSDMTIKNSNEIIATYKKTNLDSSLRKDLTGLPVMTIDGQSTLDFDDAISIERDGQEYRIGIHISDVGDIIPKDSSLDMEARARASSIYMPDNKISMLPPELSEDICSLKKGEIRPAISVFAKLTPLAQVTDFGIIPSIIKVKRQLTYYDVNQNTEKDEEIKTLHTLALHFRKHRLAYGATQITLPEINVWFNEKNELSIKKVDRESPGRLLVSEMMILANWLMARFLSDNDTPAIFRSQPPPKERIIKDDKGSIFENWTQRKFLSRGVLGHKAGNHSGLGLNAYVTATSPIRKYFDLATQRQIRAILGLESPYSKHEMKNLIKVLGQPMLAVGRIQFQRHRYWILKYLERKIGQREEAIVLDKRRSNYMILLNEYMIECKIPVSTSGNLKPKDLIHVTIQHVSARNDVLSVYM